MLIFILVGAFGAVALAATLYAILTAEVGYENETGFHAGVPGSARAHDDCLIGGNQKRRVKAARVSAPVTSTPPFAAI